MWCYKIVSFIVDKNWYNFDSYGHCQVNSLIKLALQLKTQGVLGVYVSDISAAFDTINHGVLIDRLDSQFGVRDEVSRWLHAVIPERQETVCEAGPAFIRHHSVRLRRTLGVRPRPSAFHCLYVTSRGPDQFSCYFLPYVR